ncbi:DUF2797 domain-containing protein [Ferrimonas balearica]|uniref:DUF2797 domain-containing protein n=1 Tax=Ferrimonas balearica TaxID=44012 RepID=UPI001C98FDAD|nr:DUF2797 domain-containing protein [Ferrimonas balearica]MBY5921574.1 DUF2797 domain-containing protein [Ferrimonas balearica]MBY5995086.1 DUF2797 domain-containing protein [Ferrimonas balearica]
MQGTLSKMAAQLGQPAQYQLKVGDDRLPLNGLIGQSLTLNFTGNIYCDACGRKTSKSYSQGHCFPCMKKLARCDMCIMKPETCHFAQGTCREPEWGETHCMIPHFVYLANTSGLKVGITRHSQVPTRWLDQGATQALPILKVATRQLSGLVEVELAKLVADKTNWRAMLKGAGEAIDLKAEAERLLPAIEEKLTALGAQFGVDAIERLDEAVVNIDYPVDLYPSKIASHNFDKKPEVSGVLQGIKGQYLIFDTGVINIRKFTGYEVAVSHD